ncbi:MAG TPA: Maf family nucleotide pyrophosphatase [Pseudomonadales bacterium]
MQRTLVLASSSRWRQQLLMQLELPFETHSPNIDERRQAGEGVAEMVERLSKAKAAAVAKHYPDALIIGSDQAASLDGQLLGKPGNFERAHQQLTAQSGRCVDFHTGLCLLDSATGSLHSLTEITRVHFKHLSSTQIEAYLHAEHPYDCAGSFRSEALGIALIAKLEGRDPSALVGLPLMALCDLLAKAGVDVLTARALPSP